MSQRHRILVGRFYHESNRLNPLPTTRDRFIVDEGAVILDKASGVLGGMAYALTRDDVQIIAGLSAGAPPSGLVDHDFFEAIKARLIALVAEHRPDAIALELHGAMATTLIPDAEGDLLAALKAAAGPSVPIAIGLDLHAHLTEAMLEYSDICCACKENPHSDTVECGEKAAKLLIDLLEGRFRPVTVMARVPMILPGAAETGQGPLFEIHELARELASRLEEIRDISIYNVFRFTDDDAMGQVVTVTSDGPFKLGSEVAMKLGQAIWERRDRFVDDLLSLDEALDLVRTRRADDLPFVLGDMGDRVLAGAPGDSVAILAALIDRYPELRAAISITDPAAVAAAITADIGQIVSLEVGGRITPGAPSLAVTGRVIHISDGDFVLKGPFHGGEKSALGPCAVLRIEERIDLLLTSLPAYGHDPAVYTGQGIDLAAMDLAVAKSGYHFMLNYKHVATPLLVRTPGVGYYGKGLFSYEKSRFWPEHEIEDPDIKVKIFDHAPPADTTGDRRRYGS